MSALVTKPAFSLHCSTERNCHPFLFAWFRYFFAQWNFLHWQSATAGMTMVSGSYWLRSSSERPCRLCT